MRSNESDGKKSIRDQVQAVIDKENSEMASEENAPADLVDARFVHQCYNNNERGDGILYATIMNGRFVFNKTTERWLFYNGHHWSLDKMTAAHAAIEEVALKYAEHAMSVNPEITELEQKKADAEIEIANLKQLEDSEKGDISSLESDVKKYSLQITKLKQQRTGFNKRANRLRAMRGAKNCIEWSHKIEHPLAIISDVLDQRPHLLPCTNGVIDLRTGKIKPGNPADYLLKAISVDYDPKATCPTWEKFILEIHNGDPELASFIKRVLGYAISGLTSEHFIATFVGEGRNGKGTMFETIADIMGDLAWFIQPEMILEQKTSKSSSSHSADLISLWGRRLVIASETDDNKKISGSKIKQLTGADTITARGPHERDEVNFKPTHTLFLYTNHIPKGLTKDFALLKRLLFIKYPLKFIDDPDPDDPNQRPRDPALPAKLAKEKEGILKWLVDGHLEWRANGIKPPESVKADVEELRRQEDDLGRFIDDCCVAVMGDETYRVKFSTFHDAYKEWYALNVSDNKNFTPKAKAVTAELRRRGYNVPSAKETSGTVYLYGLQVPESTTGQSSWGQ